MPWHRDDPYVGLIGTFRGNDLPSTRRIHSRHFLRWPETSTLLLTVAPMAREDCCTTHQHAAEKLVVGTAEPYSISIIIVVTIVIIVFVTLWKLRQHSGANMVAPWNRQVSAPFNFTRISQDEFGSVPSSSSHESTMYFYAWGTRELITVGAQHGAKQAPGSLPLPPQIVTGTQGSNTP